jgi:alanine dehydrogenase
MRIGLLKETKNQEYRVAITPASAMEIIKAGHEFFVQSGAGLGIGIADSEYEKLGAKIVKDTKALIETADLIVKVKEPTEEECNLLNKDKTIFTFLHLAALPKQMELLQKSGAKAIAYETVTSPLGSLPLLTPMSEVAGRLAILSGSQYLLKNNGGKGVLLNGVAGVDKANVVIIGAGVVGVNAMQTAVGAGARVIVLDKNIDRLRQLDLIYGNKITVLYSSHHNVMESIKNADLVIGAVLIPGASAPKIITKDMLKHMQPKTVIVDVAIDQGGMAETSKPTTYDNPVYEVDNIIHYCVANMPGGVAKTSSFALSNATNPFILELANKGINKALLENPHLLNGLNVASGNIVHKGLADSFNVKYVDAKDIIR